ncbi:MAG: hypothetical protein Q7J31_04615, partial [Syntrophales bacterium]|nr:hypothetical protein [Syntrophales bacterium]
NMANMTPKPYAMRATWQPRLNCNVTIAFTFLLFQESEELRYRYRYQPEHQMRHHLARTRQITDTITWSAMSVTAEKLNSWAGCSS